jgi:anti-anti-sigma factor
MGGNDELIINQTVNGKNLIVSITGPLDHETAATLGDAVKEAITGECCPHTILDLREIATLDSAVIAVLIHAKRTADAGGCSLWILVTPDRPPDRLLTAASLMGFLNVIYEMDDLGPKPRPIKDSNRPMRRP